jgi:hypothetical protein
MPLLAKIPYVDIGDPVALLRRDPECARRLVNAARGTFGPLSHLASAALLPAMDRISRRWLADSRNPYLAEIAQIAETVRVAGAYTLNICFEWGCTAGVWSTSSGAALRRVLDWPFRTLGESVVVARQTGPAGEFLNVTWPGFSGVLQAMAPGRFAAAINQAPMRRHGAGFAGDWALGRIAVRRKRALPPVHLLRQVFETAHDYAEAKGKLCTTPVAVPAIFILSGTRAEEGCVIERVEASFSVREMQGGRVCAANHFESPSQAPHLGWRARPIDSYGRIACARDLGAEASDFSWFAPPIANVNSRLVLTANVTDGSLAVMGTAGLAPVTEVFRLAKLG